ncbi:MAG: PilN domain-containing protein [Rhodoferax sp.]|nr:PilN domain-containing protein [Rhodoferax sp.]
MPQNINLCTPAYRPPRQPFNAHTLAAVLVAAMALGGGACGYVLTSMQRDRQAWTLAMRTHADELQALQRAIAQRKAAAQPAAAAMEREQHDAQAQTQLLEKQLQVLQEGLLPAGQRHSDRLRLIARTIPAPVWITGVRAHSAYLELSGWTVEPAALNAWMAELSASALLKGVPLAAVKVQRGAPVAGAPAALGLAAPASAAEVWSFQLVSAPPTASPMNPQGDRP